MLPKGWVKTTLGDTTQFVSRGRSPSYVVNSDLPVVNQRSVRWAGVDEQHLKFVDPTSRDRWSPDLFVREDDILWNSTGTGTIGRAALFKHSRKFGQMVVDSHVTIVRANRSLDPHYLFALIKSPLVQDVICEMQSGSTNQVELNRSAVLSTQVPLPPLAEQRRIVAKLDALTARLARARAELERVPTLAQSLRSRAIRLAYSGQLTADWRSSDTHDLVSSGLPRGWRTMTLGEIAEVTSGITIGKKRDPNTTTISVPYLRVANVQRGSLQLSKMKSVEVTVKEASALMLRPGDILMNEGGDRDKLGRGWIWNGEIESCIHQNHVFRVRLKDHANSPAYVSHFANEFGQDYFLEHGTQTTNLASVSKAKVSALPIPLAPPDEQREILRRLHAAFARADRLEAEATRARALLDRLEAAILAKAFRGELVSQDPADEPAAVLLDRIRAERAAAPKPKRGRRAATP